MDKAPVTEMDYWKAIESLGGITWAMEHELANGRKRKNHKTSKYLAEQRDIIKQLVQEVCDKFDVIHPKDCPKVPLGQEMPPAPPGKVYYWDWYHRMKDLALEEEWGQVICSVCPFNTGVEDFKTGIVHCQLMPHTIFYRFDSRPLCGCVSDRKFSHGQFEKKMLDKAGSEALNAYKSKQQELAENWQNKYGKPFRVWLAEPKHSQPLRVIY